MKTKVKKMRRRGVATVEMAIVTPLLLTILFGIIEFGWTFMVHETATNSAREAARMAVLRGADRDEVIQRFREAMAATGLTDGATSDGGATDPCPDGSQCDDWTLTVPSQAELDDRLNNETVTIEVSIPNSKISIAGLAAFIGFDKDLYTSCSMRKEGLVSVEE